ncbi:unnamed protein product [Citrullus colocynthis]|uniref:Uncharacterized protein n=1 Tax=Citrullus colocynthis TaxID=252529 RepID=A0ABP0YYN1_9ROSI
MYISNVGVINVRSDGHIVWQHETKFCMTDHICFQDDRRATYERVIHINLTPCPPTTSSSFQVTRTTRQKLYQHLIHSLPCNFAVSFLSSMSNQQ